MFKLSSTQGITDATRLEPGVPSMAIRQSVLLVNNAYGSIEPIFRKYFEAKPALDGKHSHKELVFCVPLGANSKLKPQLLGSTVNLVPV